MYTFCVISITGRKPRIIAVQLYGCFQPTGRLKGTAGSKSDIADLPHILLLEKEPVMDGIYKGNKSGGICNALTEQCERVFGKQGIPQFKVIAERGLEKGVSFCIGIKRCIIPERVQSIEAGALDTPAEIEVDGMVVIGAVLQVSCRKQLCIFPCICLMGGLLDHFSMGLV